MKTYLSLLQEVLKEGQRKSTRAILPSTGKPIDAKSLFGRQVRFDLSKGFPVVTTKKLYFKGVVHELLWFLKGSTNIAYLQKNQVGIWDEWADESGELGPVYGKQWRSWKGYKGETYDQIQEVCDTLKKDPNSRRLIVSAWNVAEIQEMALPPCHVLFQFYVAEGKLSCQLYQRSADIFLGVPFNIASYALLTCMIAQVAGLKPGEFIHTFGDLHLYGNHIEPAMLQLKRTPYPLPVLHLNPNSTNINQFSFEDITLKNYQYHPTIKAEVAV